MMDGDAKAQREKIIAGILMVVFLLFLGRAYLKRRKGGAAPKVKVTEKASAVKEPAIPPEGKGREKSAPIRTVKYEGASFRDPMTLPKSLIPRQAEPEPVKEEHKKEEPVVLPQMALKGIIWRDENPMAIIDDDIVGVGAEIAGAEVKNIDKDSVELIYKEKAFTLKME